MSQAAPVSAPAPTGIRYHDACGSSKSAEDARWFSEEVQPHEPALRAYLRLRFPKLQDIDDQIQETYARVLRARESGRRQTTRAYLFVIARNAALDLFRRKRALPVIGLADVDSLAVAEDCPTAAEAFDHAHDLAVLEAAVNALPDRCREVFTLRRLHDFSHREIADKLGISEHTVNAQLVQGMMRCRAFLRAHYASTNLRAYANARA
jgi:RNA polymerase sigma factor (sigma-70 family)